jgi:hypothetical protein
MHALSNPASGRPPVEQLPPSAPGGRSVPLGTDLTTEVAALAELLAQVVHLTRQRAIFPSQWEQVAELALEHASVRAALAGWPG